MLDGDPSDLRARYLFDFAHICHVGPQQVDALRFMDFVNLVIAIDAYYEAKKKEAQGG